MLWQIDWHYSLFSIPNCIQFCSSFFSSCFLAFHSSVPFIHFKQCCCFFGSGCVFLTCQSYLNTSSIFTCYYIVEISNAHQKTIFMFIVCVALEPLTLSVTQVPFIFHAWPICVLFVLNFIFRFVVSPFSMFQMIVVVVIVIIFFFFRSTSSSLAHWPHVRCSVVLVNLLRHFLISNTIYAYATMDMGNGIVNRQWMENDEKGNKKENC